MTVIDQLRHAATLDERVTELEAAVVHARDVLTSDLTGQELYEALGSVVDHLERVTSGFSTLAEEPKTGNSTSSKDAAAPIVAKKSTKVAKKSTSKAARRSVSPAPAASQATEKRCPTCDTVKPLTEFNKNRSTKDGYQTHCRDCQKAHARKSRGQNTNRVSRSGKDTAKAVRNPGQPASKVCERCNHRKPRSAFAPLVTAKDGLQKSCNDCLRHALDEPARQSEQTTVTPSANGTGLLTVVCPDHGVIARGGPAPLQTETGWMFQQKSRHRAQTGCELDVELGKAAA